MRGSSGIQRTLKFSQYLPQSGWGPVMLSAHPRAYANPGDDQMGDIPSSVPVTRAFALDTARHLAIGGRYAGFMALPDRWASWCLGAIPAGWRLIRRHRPAVIWSTYPIASAHLIGLVLRRLTGLPWVADLRDPMTDVSYPSAPRTRRVFQWIERKTIEHCTVAVCTTPGAIKTYETRFPSIPRERFRLIENAYDEENFADAERGGAASVKSADVFGDNGVGASIGKNHFAGVIETRKGNGISYILPSNLGGIYGQVQYVFGESLSNAAYDKAGDYLGARIGYRNGPLDTAIAFAKGRGASAAADADQFNIFASYDLGVVKPFIGFNQEKNKAAVEVKYQSYLLGLTAPVGPGTIRVSYNDVDLKNSSNDAQKFAIGYVYDLSKRTALY
eukprot:gene42863-53182_t